MNLRLKTLSSFQGQENFEGDIELNETQALIINAQNAFGLTKSGIVTRWPTHVPIAYEIHSDHERRTYIY